MKKYLSMMAIAMLVACFFVSCSDDDDDLGSSSDLIGTWVMVSYEGYEIDEGKKETYKGTYDISDQENMITFEKDGTYFSEEDDDGSWKYSNGILTITWHDYDYGDDEIIKVKVIKLTSSEMVIEEHHKDRDEEYEYYSKMTFRKLK